MSRLLLVVICLAVILPACAFAQDVIVAEVEPFEDYIQPFTRDMYKGIKGEDVRLIQQRLTELGYLSDYIDGNFGAKTEKAVSAFQNEHQHLQLTQIGVADKPTIKALMSPDALLAALKRYDRGNNVIKLQNALIEYGFLNGSADGVFGKSTVASVTALQTELKNRGLEGFGEDGSANYALQELLYSGTFNPYRRDLTIGDTGNDVLAVSRKLMQLGYTDYITDEFDEYTQRALVDFQELNSLEANGAAGIGTFEAMFLSEPVKALRMTKRDLKYQDRGDSVLELQLKLIELGFMSPYTTGRFDSYTVSAIERLRKIWPEYPGDSAREVSVEAQEAILNDKVPVYTADARLGDKSIVVARVMRRLSMLFYIENYQIDDTARERFETAVKSFQEKNGLLPTGVADEATQSILFSKDAISNGSKHLLRIATDEQQVYAYEMGSNGQYNLVKTMICSTGAPDTPTPYGVYRSTTGPRNEWYYFRAFHCWAQYIFVIRGPYLFHSILFNAKNEASISQGSVINLGKPVSHGCVRLTVEDAKWVYENCEPQTIVIAHPR